MQDTRQNENVAEAEKVETEEPPAFEELPEWFQQEIIDNNVRLSVDQDIRRSHNKSFHIQVVLGAIFANLMAISMSNVSGGGTFAMIIAAVINALLVIKFEPCISFGILMTGAVNLPTFFACAMVSQFTAFDLPPFFACCIFLLISGALVTFMVEAERRETLPF